MHPPPVPSSNEPSWRDPKLCTKSIPEEAVASSRRMLEAGSGLAAGAAAGTVCAARVVEKRRKKREEARIIRLLCHRRLSPPSCPRGSLFGAAQQERRFPEHVQ